MKTSLLMNFNKQSRVVAILLPARTAFAMRCSGTFPLLAYMYFLVLLIWCGLLDLLQILGNIVLLSQSSNLDPSVPGSYRPIALTWNLCKLISSNLVFVVIVILLIIWYGYQMIFITLCPTNLLHWVFLLISKRPMILYGRKDCSLNFFD